MNYPKINHQSKIIILGTSGSGKTTLAQKLAMKYDLEKANMKVKYKIPPILI